MSLPNSRAPVKNFSPDFYDVFVQVIKLRYFYVAANQAIATTLVCGLTADYSNEYSQTQF